jgi:hypothetical protein
MRRNALVKVGESVESLDSGGFGGLATRVARRLGLGLEERRFRRGFLSRVRNARPELVWIDKGLLLDRETLEEARSSSGAVLTHFNPDDPFGEFGSGWDTFIEAIPAYDVHFVPRPQNLQEYRSRGARCVLEGDWGYDPNLHRPVALSAEDRRIYGTDVGFVGSWARARGQSLARLAAAGVAVTIRGDGWKGRESWSELAPHHRGPAAMGEEYVKVLCGMEIALNFLRRENRDTHTTRSYEIPACGVFMLADRTPKHLELFEEGTEAEFFESDEELLDKIRRYLKEPERRRRVASAGRDRCLRSGYSYPERMRRMVDQAVQAAHS